MKSRCANSISIDPSQTGGLHKQILLAIGLRYEITTNVDVKDGITNGSQCHLKLIDYRHSSEIPPKPSILWALFDNPEIGINTRAMNRQYFKRNIQPSWTPIFAIKRQFFLYPTYAHVQAARNQFPLTLSAARTIHKSQGSTMDKVVVTLPNKRNPHMHYVALSRVTSLNGLYIKEFNHEKIKVREDVKEEVLRLRNFRPETLSYVNPDVLSSDCLKVAFLNCRSLHAHIKDVKNDHDLEQMDIIAFAETRLTSTDHNNMYSLQNFDMFRNDQAQSHTSRPPHGLVLYTKSNLIRDVTDYNSYTSTQFEYSYFTYNMNQFVIIYRSPSSNVSEFIQKYKHALENLNDNLQRLIIGDFNIDASDEKNKSVIQKLEDISGCKQIVIEPTTNYDTTIDLAFTNIPRMSYSCIESIWSDHKILFCYVNSDTL